MQTVRVLWGQTNFYSSTIDANQSQAALIGVAKSRAFRTQFQSVIDLSPSVNTILDIHFQFLPLYGLLCHSIHEFRCQGGQKFCHQFQPLTAIQSNEVEVTFRYNSLSKFIWFIHHALLIREQAALFYVTVALILFLILALKSRSGRTSRQERSLRHHARRYIVTPAVHVIAWREKVTYSYFIHCLRC